MAGKEKTVWKLILFSVSILVFLIIFIQCRKTKPVPHINEIDSLRESIDSIQISPVVEEVAIPEQQESEVVSEKTEMKGGSDSDTDMLLQEAQSKDEEPLAETEEEVKKMSLLSRFVGSIIDKIFILIIFVVGFIAISPYGAPGKMGTYIGLRNTPLDLYEYIDKSAASGVSRCVSNAEVVDEILNCHAADSCD